MAMHIQLTSTILSFCSCGACPTADVKELLSNLLQHSVVNTWRKEKYHELNDLQHYPQFDTLTSDSADESLTEPHKSHSCTCEIVLDKLVQL